MFLLCQECRRSLFQKLINTGSIGRLPAFASFFGLMSFTWTVGLDAFGCLVVFDFMVLFFLYLVLRAPSPSQSLTTGVQPPLTPDASSGVSSCGGKSTTLILLASFPAGVAWASSWEGE